MAQASALTDTEIRRVFRAIETTRYADRNRLAFALSIFAGLRVGEIAALKLGDVTTQNGEVRREIAVGVVKSGSREPSISASVVPGRAVRLTHIMGCLSAKEIGRIESRYK